VIRTLLIALVGSSALAMPASAESVLETAARLFAGVAVRSGSEAEGVYTYKPSLQDMLALANDPKIAVALNGLTARGVPITITSELSQPDHCLFEIKTDMDARGIFASTYTVRVDLLNTKAAAVRKRPDGQLEGTLLGEANLACHRFSVTARDTGSDPGIPKCDNVSSTIPIERDPWIATAREMSAKYCPLGKIE
jgi:hypothetical protein